MRQQRLQKITSNQQVTRRSQRGTLKSYVPPFEHLLTYADLATITGESVTTHRRRKGLGTGPRFLLIGRHVRFRNSDVVAWLESCSQRGDRTA